MKIKPYPEYKDSGVPWLGGVPRHWNELRLGQIAFLIVSNVDKHSRDDEVPVRLCNYVDVYKNERITENIDFMKATASTSEIARFRIKMHDVLITKDSEVWDDIAVPALVEYESSDLLCGYHLAILRPKPTHIIGPYLFRLIQSKHISAQFHIEANGVTRYGLSHGAIKRVFLTIPPIEVQTQIARFLDWKTAQIDRFIRAKRQLIERLKEQKQALINQAVTGRIDVRTGKPYPEYKDSGISWLGKVPKDWNIRKFKYLACFSSGGTPSKSIDSYWDGELPWVSPKDMKGKEVRNAEDRISEQAVQDSATGIAKPGDLLIVVRSGILRRTIPVGIVKREVAFNQDIKAIAPKQDTFSSDYLLFLINGCDHLLRDEWVKVGATVESIEHELMANTHLPVPTLEEQGSITDFCRRIEDSVCKTITRTQREIELIQEYRTRLIADVVTGKLDVRDVEVPEVDALEEALGEGVITGDAVAQDSLEVAM